MLNKKLVQWRKQRQEQTQEQNAKTNCKTTGRILKNTKKY